ncbi:acyloxyacyl hydrolase [Hymenobacter mucosus]|uniref:Lipid A 3-O-deacylase (PagL) n=1 Tax=Hymenobacter mucosus TaxID=1411120 RepID=A0A239B4K5_9BACT|nr:acyloxyacyl hydrolase [Hymenobacter mucosus]SNS02830.1 Lipid A 3-O-deacylase (PagL) [Hymenobacter mucosus]
MTIRLRVVATGLLGIVGVGKAHAQQQQTPVGPLVLGAYAQGSFILAHTPAVKHLAVSHPTGLELNVQRQTNGSAPWHAWYRYPKVGLALVYYDYHNTVLGRSYAATMYINKSFWRTQRQELSFRLGTGVGFFPIRYDQATNHKNTIISSRLNATIQFRAEYDVALSEHLGLMLGAGLNHYSNGATTKPNFGINLPTVLLGFNYHQQRPFTPLPPDPASEPTDVGHNRVELSTTVGIKQRNETDRRKYLVNSLTLAATRRLNRKSLLTAGLEGFYDRSLSAQLRDTARTNEKLPDVKKAGVYIGHELLFGRLSFVSHLGFYVYNPYKSNKFYYERLGLKYYFTDRVFGNVDLKVHRGSADVIEFRVGARL